MRENYKSGNIQWEVKERVRYSDTEKRTRDRETERISERGRGIKRASESEWRERFWFGKYKANSSGVSVKPFSLSSCFFMDIFRNKLLFSQLLYSTFF